MSVNKQHAHNENAPHAGAEALRAAGLKATPARLKILDIFEKKREPLGADHLTGSLPSVNGVTIYRALASFEAAGILKRVDLRQGSARYELAARAHHHHIVCDSCGLVEDFDSCGIDDTLKAALKQSSFSSIDSHSFELFGTCKKCAMGK